MPKKILLTGGSGLVGKNIQNHPEFGAYKFLIPSRRELNLLDYEAVSKYLKHNRPEFVVHAAGRVGGIAANIANPVEFLDENFLIGRNVIMGAKEAGIEHLLNLSSSCIYPKLAKSPLCEDQILTGSLEPTNEGYAIAKIFALRLCEYITQSHERLQFKTLIPCNLYGPFDKFDQMNAHLVPSIISKIHEAKVKNETSVTVWGDGSTRREFMFVGDLTNAIFKAIREFANLPDNMNIGVGFDHTIIQYYEAVAEMIGWNGTFEFDLSKPSGMKQKLCDISLQEKWGWKAETSLRQGISKTYEYFLEVKK